MSQGPPSNRPAEHAQRPQPAPNVEASLTPEAGWHVLHLFYRIDRAGLGRLAPDDRARGRTSLIEALTTHESIAQLHCFTVMGHKADFGVMAAGTDLRALRALQTRIAASPLGPVLALVDSFCSLTEVSEYVPDVERYAAILREREKMDPESAQYKTRVTQYANRLEAMNRQRLTPEFPDWPCYCFYPMSKMRVEGQNWFMLPFEQRNALMADHGKSGMAFAGRVTQLITSSTGLDDWEWGVTLWARNPQYIREIVYTMRFDEASARYALFGSFYYGYILDPQTLIDEIAL